MAGVLLLFVCIICTKQHDKKKMINLFIVDGGESGSGKSTVIALLQRFYDRDSGLITIDGIDIQKIQLKWVRHQMRLVRQEPILFMEREGMQQMQKSYLISALELANAHKFLGGLLCNRADYCSSIFIVVSMLKIPVHIDYYVRALIGAFAEGGAIVTDKRAARNEKNRAR